MAKDNLSYTGEIHHGPSTVSAVFFNAGQQQDVLCDERTAAEYIDLYEGSSKDMYVSALNDLQAYKAEKNIKLDYLPYSEWENE